MEQSIKIEVHESCWNWMSVNKGDPQGYVLAPTLYILHINDKLQTSNIDWRL